MNDILFSIAGTIGETSIVTQSHLPANTNQALAIIKGTDRMFVPVFLKLQLDSFVSRVVKAKARGGAMSNVSLGDLMSLRVFLPPLAEQHRIVAKIEELFSDLDAGIASLKTAQAQLKIYRQAVLKWAFEGKLTAEWRKEKQQKGELKSTDELLAQIKAEREKRYKEQVKEWETAVKAWEAGGKVGKKPTKPKMLKEVEPLSEEAIAELLGLPEGWIYVRSESISDFITKGTTPDKDELRASRGDIPFIKVYNLTNSGTLDFSVNPTFVSNEIHAVFLSRSKVIPGDILMNIVGPPLGKVSLIPDTFKEWNINQAIARYRLLEFVWNKYFLHYLLSQVTIDRMSKKAKATAGQFNLTLEICREVEVPVCSQEEQKEIVQEIESRLSICDSLEATINENLQRAEALRQSILKHAFEGKLVPQDPNDEPAEKLLERIKQEKSKRLDKQLKIEGI